MTGTIEIPKGLKVGQTSPIITKEQALIIHNAEITCSDPCLVEIPHCRIERTSIFSPKKFFSRKSWGCFKCKWQSEIMTTRTA